MTINENNRKVYETVFQQKALTEYIIGITNYSFPFVKATYKAVCTDAVDFTMFDKVICGILQIDEVLGFEEIAEILGLNVVHRPEEGKYIDFGEKEILEYAINSLVDFDMIETGDIYHSRCRLTDIGKEYAAKGKKFLPATEKEFEIIYDLTDKKHSQAKKRYGKLEEVFSQQQGVDLNIEDESFVKEIAKSQVPEIYNPDKLKNFTNLELQSSNTYFADFTIVGLASFGDKSFRHLAFDNHDSYHPSISEMINSDISIGSNILEILIDKSNEITENEKSKIQKNYEQKARVTQDDIQKQLSAKKVNEAIEKSKGFYLTSEIIEEEFLELNFDDFFDAESREFWIIIKELNEDVFQKIKKIIKNRLGVHGNLIIITQPNIQEKHSLCLLKISKSNPYVFFGIAEEIVQSILLSKNGNDKWAIFKKPIIIEVKNESIDKIIEKEAFIKTPDWNEVIVGIYKQCKSSLANEYLKITKEKIEKTYEEFMEDPMSLSKNGIENLSLHSRRLSIFRNVKEITKEIGGLYKGSREKIDNLKGLLQFKLEEEFKDIENKYQEEDAKFTISKLRELEDNVLKISAELIEVNSEFSTKIVKLKTELEAKINTLSNSQKNRKSQRKKTHPSTTKKR